MISKSLDLKQNNKPSPATVKKKRGRERATAEYFFVLFVLNVDYQLPEFWWLQHSSVGRSWILKAVHPGGTPAGPFLCELGQFI